MKRIYTRIAAFLCAAILMTAGTAIIAPAADTQCSLTLCLADIGTPADKVVAAVYQVAEPESGKNLQSFLPVQGLENMKEAFLAEHLNHAASVRKTAEQLASEVDVLGIAGIKAEAGEDGRIFWSDLKPGIYLVKQVSGEDTYGSIQPFLVVLPYMEEETGMLLYDMEAAAKAEEPSWEPTVTPTPQPTVTPTSQPTATPTPQPTVTPATQLTVTPTPVITQKPTEGPASTEAPGGGGHKDSMNEDGRPLPKTGDETDFFAWFLLLCTAMTGIKLSITEKKKRKNK